MLRTIAYQFSQQIVLNYIVEVIQTITLLIYQSIDKYQLTQTQNV